MKRKKGLDCLLWRSCRQNVEVVDVYDASFSDENSQETVWLLMICCFFWVVVFSFPPPRHQKNNNNNKTEQSTSLVLNCSLFYDGEWERQTLSDDDVVDSGLISSMFRSAIFYNWFIRITHPLQKGLPPKSARCNLNRRLHWSARRASPVKIAAAADKFPVVKCSEVLKCKRLNAKLISGSFVVSGGGGGGDRCWRKRFWW